jgi:hypothetical protein
MLEPNSNRRDAGASDLSKVYSAKVASCRSRSSAHRARKIYVPRTWKPAADIIILCEIPSKWWQQETKCECSIKQVASRLRALLLDTSPQIYLSADMLYDSGIPSKCKQPGCSSLINNREECYPSPSGNKTAPRNPHTMVPPPGHGRTSLRCICKIRVRIQYSM